MTEPNIRDNYKIALNFITTNALSKSIDGADNVEYSWDEVDSAGNDIPDHFRVFSKFSFEDAMDIEPENGNIDHQDHPLQLALASIGVVPPLTDEVNFYNFDTFQNGLSSVVKAMMVALLDNNGKRTTTLASRTIDEQKEIFFNALKNNFFRDTTSLPWSTWRDSHSTVNISSVKRYQNYAIFTVTGGHGLSDTFDDWGAIININNAIFDTIPSKYNGDSLIVVSPTQFAISNDGLDTAEISVTGTADIRIGWGGSKINYHQYSG